MMRVLRCDVYPLVQDDSCHGNRHQSIALIAIKAEGLRGEHLPKAAAFHVGEGFDVPVLSSNPAQRTGCRCHGIDNENRARTRDDRAFSMEKNCDGVLHIEAIRCDLVSSDDLKRVTRAFVRRLVSRKSDCAASRLSNQDARFRRTRAQLCAQRSNQR